MPPQAQNGRGSALGRGAGERYRPFALVAISSTPVTTTSHCVSDLSATPREDAMCSIAVLIIVCGTLTTSLGCDKPKKKEHQAGSGQTTGVLATSKGKATPKKPAGPTRAGAVSVGTKVMAPYRGSAKRHPGTVTELYGKLAHINFDDGTDSLEASRDRAPRSTG